MKNFTQNTMTGFLLATTIFTGQAQAEIQTSVVAGSYKNSDEVKTFSKSTPCYIVGSNDFPENFAKTVQIFKDVGFNITEDDGADCKIVLFGEVNYGQNTPEQTIYSVRAMSGKQPWPDKSVSPNPAILEKANAAKAQLTNPNKPAVDGNGINILAQAGQALGGSAGSAALGGAGALINLFTSFNAGPTTPEGMESTEGQILFGHLFKTTEMTVKIYAASNTPEKPEDLYYAGIKRTAETLEAAIYECHVRHNIPFDMPIPTPENSKMRPPEEKNVAPSVQTSKQD